MSSTLYDRQMRLAEVGEAGQARIQASEFTVSNDDSAEIELAYLSRAGARVRRAERAEPAAFPHAGAFRFAEARRVAEGSWRALSKLRAALGLAGS